jgi:hypothetical protein
MIISPAAGWPLSIFVPSSRSIPRRRNTRRSPKKNLSVATEEIAALPLAKIETGKPLPLE